MRLQLYLVLYIAYTSALVFVLVSCGQPGKVNIAETKSSAYETELRAGLQSGAYLVTYHAHKMPRDERLRAVQGAGKLFKDAGILSDTLHRYDNIESILYSDSSGLMPQQLTSLLEAITLDDLEVFTDTLEITASENSLLFRGRGRLNFLDSLQIFFESEIASWRETSLELVPDSLTLPLPELTRGDSWISYQIYRGPGGMLGLVPAFGESELIVGRISPGNRFYLSFFINMMTAEGFALPELITFTLDPERNNLLLTR